MRILMLIIFLFLNLTAYAEGVKIDCKKLSPVDLRNIDPDDCVKKKAVISNSPENHIDKFYKQTHLSSLTCEMAAHSALLELELGNGKINSALSSINSCLEKEKPELKRLFIKAMSSASKKPAAAKLLKDYYSTWMTAFNTIEPRLDDRQIDYKLRRDAELSKTNAAWDKFEIEFEM